MKSSDSKNNIDQYVDSYLSHRPAFYSLIRTQELYYFNKYSKYIKSKSLDFGCGDGFFASHLSLTNQLDVGLDVEQSRIHETEYRDIYKKKVIYSGQNIPFKTNHFNSSISNCVLEHLPDLSLNLQEIHRTLKPGGHFITTVMTDRWEQHLTGRKIAGNHYLKLLRNFQDHLNLLSYQKWTTAFNKAGFKQVLVKGYLNSKTVKYNELFHYLSFPQLLSYKFFKKWVPVKNWHQHFSLSAKISQIILNDINSPVNESGALFFILQK